MASPPSHVQAMLPDPSCRYVLGGEAGARLSKRLGMVTSADSVLRRLKVGPSVEARGARAPVLRKSRWLLLRRSENLGADQHFRLRDLLRYNLKTVVPTF